MSITEHTALRLGRLASPRRPTAPGKGGRWPAALLLRLGCAALLAWIGYIHLHLWQEGYRQIPTNGPLFLLDAVAGFALAAVLLACRLDAEVQSYAHHEHRNLAAAEAALRAEAVTERWFDARLLKIPFAPPAAATAQALVQANERRAELAVRQAGSPSLTELQSFTRRHQSADAAVEAQVKAIRRTLGLPPPETS